MRSTRTTRTTLPVILAATALALAGCSSSGTTASSPSATATTKAPACVDGTMTIAASDAKAVNATVDCDTVVVEGDSKIVSLRTVKTVEITGSKNTVTVDSAAAITVSGDSNRVFYGAAQTPKVTDTGSANSVGER